MNAQNRNHGNSALGFLLRFITTLIISLFMLFISTFSTSTKRRAAGKEFSTETKRIVKRRANDRDEITGKKLAKGHFHHIIPVSWGGSNDPDNCALINVSTHNYIHDVLSGGHFNLNRFRRWFNLIPDPTNDDKFIILHWLEINGCFENREHLLTRELHNLNVCYV